MEQQKGLHTVRRGKAPGDKKVNIHFIRFSAFYYAHALNFNDTLPFVTKKNIFVISEPEESC